MVQFHKQIATGLVAVLVLAALAQSGRVQAAESITFASPVLYTLNDAGDVTTADFDDDGHQDIAVASNRKVNLLYGNGTGAFTAIDMGGDDALISEIIGADVNADRLPDLVYCQEDRSAVAVRLNLGNRTFGEINTYAVARKPYGVCAGDFNEDGWNDLAVTSNDLHQMGLLLNDADGTFGEYQGRGAGSFPARILTTDCNGDDHLDLAMSAYVSGDVNVWLGDGHGAFTGSDNFGVGQYPAQIVTADFNRDGKPDLATANTFGHSITTRLGDGTGKFIEPNTYSTVQYPHIMRAADFNGDGYPDLAAPNNGTSLFTVLRNLGDGTMAAPFTVNSGGTDTRTLTTGDYNGDGRTDLAVGNGGSKTVAVFLNTTPFPPPAAPTNVSVAAITATSVRLEWTPPENAAEQQIEAGTKPGGFVLVGNVSGTAGSFTHVDLPPSTTFNYRIRALNSAGESPYSATVSARTLIGLLDFRIQPKRVKGGKSARGTLRLSEPAPAKGATISLSSDSDAVKGPDLVEVKPGKSLAKFNVRTKKPPASQTATISAALNDSVRQAQLKISK